LNRNCSVIDLGVMDYGRAWELQKELAQQVADGSKEDTLLLVEHPPVFTLGRRSKETDLLISGAELEAKGIQIYWVDRGGAATYHGPGQLVAYPILNLKNWAGGPSVYVHALANAVIDTLAESEITGHWSRGFPGVWIEEGLGARQRKKTPGPDALPGRKIAAVGVRINRNISTHGIALNVDVDLTRFDHIVPCGFQDLEVTSMERELNCLVDLEKIKNSLVSSMALNLGLVVNSRSLYR
jgi:lipoyl(octanoyl) transferase